MQEIILSGISLSDFQNSIKEIVQKEVQKVSCTAIIPTKETFPEFITRKETAKILGVSLPTLHDWTKRGVIPAHRIGTRVRYDRQIVYNSIKEVETLKYRRA